ncbi:DNA binding protein [Lambiella insularis]|nr:DNA binding protein [Lambiella insularis]
MSATILSHVVMLWPEIEKLVTKLGILVALVRPLLVTLPCFSATSKHKSRRRLKALALGFKAMAPAAAVLDRPKAKPKARARPKAKSKKKATKTPLASASGEGSTREQDDQAVESRGKVVQNAAASRSIDEHQSFEVVQTFLHVSLAYICYLRDLLPDDGFEDRDYGLLPDDVHWRYEDMLNNERPANTIARNGPQPKPLRYKILAQSAHPGAERLTSWLDGIFEVLSKKLLAGVQLSIILDREKPSSIIESYAFTIKYKDNGGTSGRQLEGLTVSASQDETVTLKDARSGLDLLTRHLSHRVENFPDLPPTRFLTVHIFYTEDSDPLYNPPLFKPLDDPSILVPNSVLWKMVEVPVGGLDAGYHHVGLQIGYLETVRALGTDVAIPQKLQYARKMLRTCNGIVDNKAQPITPQQLPHTRRLSRIQEKHLMKEGHNLANQEYEEENTQVRQRLQDIVCFLVHQNLRNITRVPPVSEELQPTQLLETPQRVLLTGESITETQSPSNEGDTDDLDRQVTSASQPRAKKRTRGEAQPGSRKSARILAAGRSPLVASKR